MAVNSKAKCRLIIDSCSDLDWSVVENAGVDYFTFPINMNDGEHPDDFWQSMTAEEFYNRIQGGEVASTAQIPMHVIYEKFEECAQEGTPTVYIAFTGGLSGTYANVEDAAAKIREKYPDFELYTVDSMLACVGEGFLAYQAICQRDRGLTAKQLAEWAEEARWFVECVFTVEDLEYLRRGGRIPSAAAALGTKLDVKPILSFNLDGSLSMIGVSRGRKKALKALAKYYVDDHVESLGTGETVLIGSSVCDKDADRLEEHLARPKDSIPAMRSSIGPTIGAHLGPGAVAVAFWGPDRRGKVSFADSIASQVIAEDEKGGKAEKPSDGE